MQHQNFSRTLVDAWRFFRWRGLALFVAIAAWAGPVSAQISRIGVNPLVVTAPMRGNDVAYDPVNHVYLVVGAYQLSVWGVFVDTSGQPVAAPFVINAQAAYAHYPRVAYSAHVSNGAGGLGGFLVTWHENVGTPNHVHTRLVAYPNRLVGSVTVLPTTATWWESGAAVAYSPSSQVFLVAWRTADYQIHGARIALNGTLTGSIFAISDPSVGGRDPSVAWNPSTNEFGVLYTGFTNSDARTIFARVTASGTVLYRNTFNYATATYITDLAFNSATGRYVGVWNQRGSGTVGAEIASTGDVVAQGLVSSATGTYDGLGISYNPVSGTFLLVGHGPTSDVWAAELNSRGARTSGDSPITSLGVPSYYPRAAARTDAAQWDISFAPNYDRLANQVVATTSTAGGPAGSLGAPPPSGGTSTSGCPGTAPFPGAICVNGGWVPGDTSGGTGGTSTGGCPGTAPFPGAICVNGGWVPGDTSGTGGTSTGGCPGTAPFPGAICVNGGWVPGDTSGTGGTSTGGCPGTAPFPGAICVNGGWVPGTSTSGCPGTAPFPGAICVNGGWVPGGTSTGGCPGTAPFPGAICVNGGWIPGSTCTTPDPFTAIGGGTCVNGGWIPSGSATSSCPGTTPFPGAICVNGGWVPSTSVSGGCTTPPPGTGWVCVNGGWLPPTNPAVGSTCVGTAPAAGWVCVNGGWLPPDNPTVATYTSGGCTTPDPFVAIGGGICINGGWIPRQ